MQQVAEPSPARERSRRFPPRRRAVDVPDAPDSHDRERSATLEARMDRLEAALRLVARANKAVLRTLDPRFDGRAELASVSERLSEIAAAAESMRAELARASSEHGDVQRDVQGLRGAVDDLTRLVEESAPVPRPVTRLVDVRARLERLSDELGQRSSAR